MKKMIILALAIAALASCKPSKHLAVVSEEPTFLVDSTNGAFLQKPIRKITSQK